MAVASALSAIIYSGNNSTSTPYQVLFGFLDPSHVFVARKPLIGNAVILTGGGVDYTLTITRDSSGNITGGSITTTVAYNDGNTQSITIFRQTSLVQPLEIPEAGALPARSMELGFDRMVFLVQELTRRILALEGNSDQGEIIIIPQGQQGGDPTQDVATFADATAQGNATPKRIGQLGVRLSNNTLWRATAIAAGAWSFVSTFSTLTIGTVDPGDPGTTPVATITGSAPNQVLNLTLVTGNTGGKGDKGFTGDNGKSGWTPVFSLYLTGGIFIQVDWTGDGPIPEPDAGYLGPGGVGTLEDATNLLPLIIPAGGTTGQVLAKASDTDFDLHWITP